MAVASGLVLLMASATSALGDHANDSCSLLSNANKQQTTVAENSSPSGSRTGVSATIRVVDPNPDVHRVIVRSLYIFENSTQADFIEFGWKWLIDEAASSYPPEDDFDFEPTVFAVRQSAFTYILSEHQTLNPGTNHAFRIEANVDGSHPSTFYFFVDGQDSGNYFHGNMQNGFVTSGSESNALCDSLFTHHWNMQRKTGAGWNTWSNVVKLTAGFGFPDKSKWWYFDKLSNGEYRLEHCGTANCGDVN